MEIFEVELILKVGEIQTKKNHVNMYIFIGSHFTIGVSPLY